MTPRWTLPAGTLLGIALLAVLTLAGVLSADTAPTVAPSKAPEAQTPILTQPRLREALLEAPSASAKPTPRVSPSKGAAGVAENCPLLLDPKALLQEAQERAGAEVAEQEQAGQVGLLTRYAGDGAAQTLRQVRRLAERCKAFRAKTSDQIVDVVLRVTRDEAGLLAMRMNFGDTTVYLTLSRVDRVLAIIKQTCSQHDVTQIDPIKLVNMYMRRLTQAR